jgi:ABC-2 type transport system ATP-binding protein
MIDVAHLTREYPGGGGVRDLTFAIGPGEIVGLVGPNGAGKTTTLRSLAGIFRPGRGTIAIAGHDLASDPVAAKRALAFVPDEPRLFEDLTVEEHLTFFGRLYGAPDATERGQALLLEHDLADKRRAFPAELSRGMTQKVAMVCALLHRPRALILDEPLTGLDPLGMRRMRETILRQAAAGTAVLLSSHLLGLVEAVCQRVLVLHRGRLLAAGTIDEIRARTPDMADASLEELFMALTGDVA